MGRLSRKLKKLAKTPLAVVSILGGNLAAAKKAIGEEKKKENAIAERAGAVTAAASAATAAQTAEQQAVEAADVEYRGQLRQKEGLASTILNLGGAAGDPTRPTASGLLGAQAPKPAAGDVGSLAEDPLERLKRKRLAGL